MNLLHLAIGASTIWICAVVAYGVGFFLRLEAQEGTGFLPTLDLLFFVFAALGPLAMLWIVVLALHRADKISEALTAQGDSAVALAATLANLNDTVADLGDGARQRIEQACVAMERQAAESAVSVDKTMSGTANRLDRVLLESAVVIDQRVADRAEKLALSLQAQQSQLHDRIVADAEALGNAVNSEMGALAEVKSLLSSKVSAALEEVQAGLDAKAAALLGTQLTGVEEITSRVKVALEDIAERQETTRSQQAEAIRTGLAEPIQELKTSLREVHESIAAHPPATAQQLTDMLGATTKSILADERKSIEGCLGRIEALEANARQMLSLIDRTSRLNPLMEPSSTPDVVDADSDSKLPFTGLPETTARTTMDWTAVVRVLDGNTDSRASRPAIERVRKDPDVVLIMRLRDRLAAALEDDRIHLEDIAPDHAPAKLWAEYAKGKRGPEYSVLGVNRDAVTTALVRARTRNDAEFLSDALRLISAYTDLIARAEADIGADPRLVELADTTAGRAVMLLGGVLRVFEGPTTQQ